MGTLCPFPSQLPPISAGARSGAISCFYSASETSLFFELFCSAGAVLERWCQRLCSAQAEHREGASHGRRKASESLPAHPPRLGWPGQGGCQKLSPPRFSHLLQPHLCGGLCLGTALGPPTLLVLPHSRADGAVHPEDHGTTVGSFPPCSPRASHSRGLPQAAASGSHLSPQPLCSTPRAPTGGSQTSGGFEQAERVFTFVACQSSCNDSSFCLAMEGTPRCSCRQRADLCWAGSSPRVGLSGSFVAAS